MRNGDPPTPLTGRLLAGKMAEWLDQLDSRTKAGILGKKEGIELLKKDLYCFLGDRIYAIPCGASFLLYSTPGWIEDKGLIASGWYEE